MKTITRTYDEHGQQVLSEPLPTDSICNIWAGDTCTVYELGDEAALAARRLSLPPPRATEENSLENE